MQKPLLAALLLVGSATAASAQTTIVKANILSPLVKTGSFFVEQRVGARSTVQLGGLFTRWGAGDTRLRGFALTPEYRRYLSADKNALQGFYLAPFLRYQHLTLTNDFQQPAADPDGSSTAEQQQATLNTYGGGLLIGHQWLFGNWFSVDAFLGPSYNDGHIRTHDSVPTNDESFDTGTFRGFGLRTGLTIGVAF